MAITFFGVATTPADNAAQAGPNVTLTPVASMVAGDLVYVSVRYRASTGTITVATSGGQAWNNTTQYDTTNIRARVFWCRFNGTWDANPQFTITTGTNNLDAQMLVFRPTSAGYTWSLESGPNNATYAAPTTPFTVTITGRTTSAESTVTIGAWHSIDDNSWGTLSGTGWSKTSLGAQYRNNSTNDNSSTFAYRIQTSAGATNNVSQNQTALGGDAGSTSLFTFAESLTTASIAGVAGAPTAGSLASAITYIGLVGIEAVAHVGTADAVVPGGGGGNATATPSGVSAAAAVGVLALFLSPVITPTGVGIGSAAGSPILSTVTVPIGAVATSAVGTITVVAASAGVVPVQGVASPAIGGSLGGAITVAGIAGVSATGAAGTITPGAGGLVHGTGHPSPVFATAAVGAPAVLTLAFVQGVSSTATAEELLGASIGEDVDGAQGATTAANVTVGISTTLPGVLSSAAVGTVSIVATAVRELVGVAATATVGNLAGITAGETAAIPAGVQAIGQVGTLTVDWTFTVPISGVEAAAQAGTADIEGGDSTSEEVFPAGVQAIAQVGVLSTGEALASPFGAVVVPQAGTVQVIVTHVQGPGTKPGRIHKPPKPKTKLAVNRSKREHKA